MLFVPACFTLGYIGPGAGLGLIGALVSLLASIGFALLMVVAWPIRAALKKRAAAGHTSSTPSETPQQP
jgi:hypothetical protein